MTIQQAACTSAKVDLLTPLVTAGLKIALYTSSADLNAATTVYTTTGEASGTGYVVGGQVLTGVSVTSGGTVAWLVFDNPVWVSSSITAAGALIYNPSAANKSVAVLSFGTDKQTSGGDFEIELPPFTATTALIRIV